MTTLQERISADWQKAMKERDPRKDVLSLIRTELKNRAINTRTAGDASVSVADAEGIDVLRRMAKQRKEAMESFAAGGRNDLVQKEKFELSVIESYLPAQMSPEAVEALIKKIIGQVGATSMKDMGKVMGVAMAEAKGQFDGGIAQAAVKKLLGG